MPTDRVPESIQLSEARIRKTQAAIVRALGLADMDSSVLARMRLRQDLVERVQRSVVRAVASGAPEARTNRLVQMLAAFDRILVELPASSALARTISAMRADVSAEFPGESASAESLASSLASLPGDDPTAPPPDTGASVMPPVALPADNRRSGRVVRR
jgi:hypothetical protein